MNPELRVAVDVGVSRHRVAVGLSEGVLLEEFEIGHDTAGLAEFFARVGRHERRLQAQVAVAMEGYNGHARPLDQQVLARGYRLFNVNNLKLARYKEIFPGPAKSDPIDTRKIFELFALKDKLPLAREVLQEVAPVAPVDAQLKALTRRRRQLVNERQRVSSRMQVDLHATCPGLLEITGQADNLWFLNFLTCRAELTRLKAIRPHSLLALRGIGKTYAAKILAWQREASFAPAVAWVGPMIIEDARRMLALRSQIQALEVEIDALSCRSALALRLGTLPGFGHITRAELAAEIGVIERFAGEASLALYLGMAPLEHSSGKRRGAKPPRQVNARAKAAMMIAVVRHMSCVAQSKAFYEKKRAQGKTHNQALRALGRQLVRVIWSMLTHRRDYQSANPCSAT